MNLDLPHDMPALNSCTRCGAQLRPLDAEGLCTRCLLESGLEESLAEPKIPGLGQNEALATEIECRTSDAGNRTGRSFGAYELIEEIARGGMGVVYRARQPSLGRIVALKMILAGQFASKQIIQRFRGEVTAAALLQHPNIVAIHDVGIHDGQHYFSMDYIEGQNLSQLVGTRPFAPAKAARYVKLLSEAIHYAHQQGILHRDLKPSNVLVDATDQPRITDFGLAKRLDGDASITMTGQMLGSPNFMPPEQASSERGKVGRPSDVYGLGAILYHLLTARPPFQAESFESVIHQVLNSEPVSPRLLNSTVPLDLETICMRCLQKEPSRRYQSAQELADELDRFLRHEPIQARPITRAERAWRWCRRNPAVAGLAMALFLAIVVGFAGVTWRLREVSREELISRRTLYTADMNRVQQAWDEGNLQLAQELLQGHSPKPGKEDLRGFEWRYLWKLCQDESLFTFTNLPFAGERNRLALGAETQTVMAASRDTLKWLDVRKHRQAQSRTVGASVITRISVASDQPGFIAYRTDRIHVLSPTGEALLGGGISPELGGGPNKDYDGAFALSADGALLAVSGTNRTVPTHDESMVRIFDVKTGKQLGPGFNLGEHEAIASLAFSPNGLFLACGTLGTKIHILEARSLKPVNVITGHTASVTFLAFDRAGRKLVSSSDGHIHLRSFPDCRLLADFSTRANQSDLAISPDGLLMAGGGIDHTVRLWNLARLEIQPTFLHGHTGRVNSVLFSRDGGELYSGGDDGTVKVWNASAQKSTNILSHPDWTDELSFSPDGKLVAVTDFNARTAFVWDVATRARKGIVGEHSGPCRGVRFSPDGNLIATAGNDGTVQISDVSTRKRIRGLPIIAGNSKASLAFHPSKGILATAREDLRFWDLRDGKRLNLLAAAPAEGVASVVFSRDGKWLALGMRDGQVFIWDFLTGRLTQSFHLQSAEVSALCFSHDGIFLASGGFDHLVVTYNLRSGKTANLGGHFDRVYGLAFAPDDKTLVSTSWDGTIRFWSMANHQIALRLAHDAGGVNSVAFSPDGNLMATAGSEGTARLWPAATLDEITALEKEKENRK